MIEKVLILGPNIQKGALGEVLGDLLGDPLGEIH